MTTKKDSSFYNSNPLKIFFSYYRPHLKYFVLDMICATLIALIDISFPVVTKYAIDSIIPNQNFKFFAVFCLAIFATFLLRKLFTWFVNY